MSKQYKYQDEYFERLKAENSRLGQIIEQSQSEIQALKGEVKRYRNALEGIADYEFGIWANLHPAYDRINIRKIANDALKPKP